MHEITDCLIPREIQAITLRETGMSYRRMGEIMGYTGARAGKIYQKACRKREKWLKKNEMQEGLLFELLPITEDIKGLTSES
jgi:hypothetical protein